MGLSGCFALGLISDRQSEAGSLHSILFRSRLALADEVALGIVEVKAVTNTGEGSFREVEFDVGNAIGIKVGSGEDFIDGAIQKSHTRDKDVQFDISSWRKVGSNDAHLHDLITIGEGLDDANITSFTGAEDLVALDDSGIDDCATFLGAGKHTPYFRHKGVNAEEAASYGGSYQFNKSHARISLHKDILSDRWNRPITRTVGKDFKGHTEVSIFDGDYHRAVYLGIPVAAMHLDDVLACGIEDVNMWVGGFEISSDLIKSTSALTKFIEII